MPAKASTVITAMANHQLNRKARPRARSGQIPAAKSSAALVKSLRAMADGILNPGIARQLMREAADEIENLQQLPLFP